MEKLNHQINLNSGSEKNFGIVFSVVFMIIGIFPILKGSYPNWWAILISAVFLTFAYFNPESLHTLNKLWFKLGLFLSSIISPLVMGLIFFIVVTPLSLIIRLIKKDLLGKNINKKTNSYWIIREKKFGSMKKQF